MRNETLPINHSTGSHVAHTAGGAVGGAVSGGIKGAFGGLFIGALVLGGLGFLTGMLLFGGWGAALISALGSISFTGGAAAAGTAAATTTTISLPAIGVGILTAVGAVVGAGAGLIGGGGIGGIFGGLGGAKRGHDQVQNDRAAAHMVDAQIGAYQAQAAALQAQATMMQGGRAGDRYANASTMLQAGSNSIQADTAERSRLMGMQLEAAR